MVNRYIRDGDNPDLSAERQHCAFDTDALAAVLCGGKDVFQRRQRVTEFVERTPALRQLSSDTTYGSKMDWTRQAWHNEAVMRRHLHQAVPDVDDRDTHEHFKKLTVGFHGYPSGLQDIITLIFLKTQCTDEQLRLFYEPLHRYEVFAAYAQTELAHGSSTRFIGTTANYDPATQEFVLNTPDLGSLKWWPGNLGKAASWCVLMARLITKGHDHGMHPFYVRIRHPDTHLPLPGVTVGEIGSNFGLVSNDNGFLGFDKVRVPLISLLAKHFRVRPDGTYCPPAHPKLAYVGLMFVRSGMADEICGQGLAMAAVVATRYSCVRRQGEIEPGKGEVKILDYRTQQYRVLPQLTRAICFILAGQTSMRLYRRMLERIDAGDSSGMEQQHVLISGLKAVTSFQAVQGIEQCRLGCGGHGYSLGSGLPHMYTFTAAGCTYEGENLVMLLQVARFLVKCAAQARQQQYQQGHQPANFSTVSPMAQHLFRRPLGNSKYLADMKRDAKWAHIQLAFEHLSRRLTFKAFDAFLAEKAKKLGHEVAWNNVSIELTKASRAYTRVFLADNFAKTVQGVTDDPVRRVLGDCLDLYLHYELLECRADLLEDGFFSGAQLDAARQHLNIALATLRPNAVNVADSFDLPDRQLNSQIGARDGRAYERLYEWAKRSPLNQHDVLPFHDQTIGRLMRETRTKNRL